MDTSFLPIIGAVVGAIGGELWRQRRIERELTAESASHWDDLGYWGRYQAQRDLRRGRVPDYAQGDALVGEVAGVMRREVAHGWLVASVVPFMLVLLALGGLLISNGEWVLGALVAVVGLGLAAGAVSQQRRLDRRLERVQAELPPRAAYER